MDRLSINEMTTYSWTFEQDVQQYLATGIGAIGVWRQKLSDFGEEKGVELLEESGLKASSLLWAGGFTGSEGTTHAESIEDALDAIRLTATLGADCLVLYTGARAGHTHNHARRLIRSALGELAPAAESAGVVLAIEPMHAGCAAEWTFLTDLDDALDLIGPLESAAVKLCFDSYHLAHDETVFDRLPELAQHVALVHLGDAKAPPQGEQNRCRLGDGVIPLARIVSTLNDAGYEGYYEVELMGEEIETSDYGELLNQSKQAYADLLGASNVS